MHASSIIKKKLKYMGAELYMCLLHMKYAEFYEIFLISHIGHQCFLLLLLLGFFFGGAGRVGALS